MGFKFGYPILIPNELSGVYLLPYSWLKYGLDHGYIVVKDKKFYDTVQGSMYLFLQEVEKKHDDFLAPWAVYQGDGIINLAKPRYIEKQFVDVPVGQFNKLSIPTEPWYNVYTFDTPNKCKTLSHSLFQLVKGCGLYLTRSVWDVPYDPYRNEKQWKEWVFSLRPIQVKTWYELSEVKGEISKLNEYFS